MKAWIADLAARLVTAADDLVEVRRLTLGMAQAGSAGAQSYLDLCRLVGEAGEPAATLSALEASLEPQPSDAAAGQAAIAVGALIVHGFAAVRGDYRSQVEAASARQAMAVRAEAAYPAIGEEFGGDVLDFAVRLVGEAVVQLSRLPASQVPLVRVETGLSLPSSLLAFDLYGDPARGAEIVDRNKTGTPMLMPVQFEALGS